MRRLVGKLGKPEQLRVCYEAGPTGMVSREHSSGERVSRGSISKAGNAHLRRIVTEAAWNYRHCPSLGATRADPRR